MLIYKVTNDINNKIYIGQTSQTLEQRKAQHLSASLNNKDNYYFHNAIRKYGKEHFFFEIIEDNILTPETLNERERYWIEYYDSYENGYNLTRGGDGAVRRNDEIILKLFLEGKTVKEICLITGYNKGTIYRSFQVNGMTEENNLRKNFLTKDRCSYPVLQYTTDGSFIKEWNSATECGEFFGSQSEISALCRQEENYLSAYGFLFKYKNDDRPIAQWIERLKRKKKSGRPSKKIKQFDLQNNLIKEYDSAAEAARALGKQDKSNICKAARQQGGKAYGFYWRYSDGS